MSRSPSKPFLYPPAARHGGRAVMPESSLVAPEPLNGSVDYSAFTSSAAGPPVDSKTGLYLGLFPVQVLSQLKDQSSVETRRAAVETMHKAVSEARNNDSIILERLKELISLITSPLNDTNFKIVLTALQLVDELISKVGSALYPFLSTLLSSYLDRISSHKYVVKQTGMRVLLHLMQVLSPSPVIREILEIGIAHKHGKVREETLNIIIASLLTFPKTDFSLPFLVEKVTPLLADGKQKVRQACLEACAVLADRLGREQLQSLLSAVLNVQTARTAVDTLNIHMAFQSRLARKLLPQLNEDGLVDHVVNVANNGRDTDELSGADVDWILAAKGTSPSNSGNNNGGSIGRKQSTSGPLKSAGKKMPWDNPIKEQAKQTQAGYASLALRQQQGVAKTMSSTLPNGVGGSSITGTKSKGYADIYKTSYEGSQQHNGSLTTPSMRLGKNTQYGSTVTSKGMTSSGYTTGPFESSLSTTWPRQNGYGTGHLVKATSRQISADSSVLAGNLLGPAKLPAIGNRPSSKPIVRNPLPFHPQPPPLPSQHSPPPPPPSHQKPPLYETSGHRPDSPSIIEESFLIGADDDADYFSIPVDDSQLNNSLSSSLTSLLFGRDMQSAAATATGERKNNGAHTGDSLSQIRKKAADWKAEILSAQCSTSTSPTNTPPLGHKMFTSPNRAQAEAVSAPVVLKRDRAHKGKISPVEKTTPFFHSPPSVSSSHQQQVWDNDTPFSKKIPLNRRENNTSFQNQTRKMSDISSNNTSPMKPKFTSPYKRPPGGLFKSPPRQFSEELSLDSSLCVNDLEANPELLSPPKAPGPAASRLKEISPPNFKLKKSSPAKATSAPQKSTHVSFLSNSTSNSAPVYRLGPQESLTEESESDSSKKYLVELSPVSNPEAALKKALQGLETSTEEWEEKCEALLLLRRLAACHVNVLLPQLHSVLMAVEKEVRNLRSQVARNAIACLGDMFGYLGKDMEPCLDTIVKTLLHVGSKSNTFYREDTEKALYEMCGIMTPARSLQALMNGGLTHCSQLIRRQVAQFMCSVVEHTVEQYGTAKLVRLPRDVLDKVVNATALLLGDADPQARYQARKMLSQLYSTPDFDAVASKVLSQNQYIKMKETIENIKVKGLGKPPLDSQSAKTTRLSVSHVSSPTAVTATTAAATASTAVQLSAPKPSNGQSPPKLRRRRSSANQAIDLSTTPAANAVTTDTSVVMEIITKMKATDWKERQEAITELEQLIMTHPNSLGSSLVKVFDVFNERLHDKNSKVNLHALEAFQRFIPMLSQQLQPALSTLVEALAGTVASRYPAIHSAALNAIDTLIATVDCTLLFPPLASAAQNGNARVQPIMLKKLSDLIPEVYDQKPSLVQRVGLPVLWKILASRSPATGEAKAAILKLCEALYVCLGPTLETSATQLAPSQQQRLQELLHTLLQNR